MKYFILLVIFFNLFVPAYVYASSNSAYIDYIYQQNIFRDTYEEYTTIKHEYDAFKTIALEEQLLRSSQNLVSQRGNVYKTYIYILFELLNEYNGLNSVEKQEYRNRLYNELRFIDEVSSQILSSKTVAEVATSSQTFDAHIPELEVILSNTVYGLQLGSFLSIYSDIETVIQDIKKLILKYDYVFSDRQRAMSERWLVHVSNYENQMQNDFEKIKDVKDKFTQENVNLYMSLKNEYLDQINKTSAHLSQGISYIQEAIRYLEYE